MKIFIVSGKGNGATKQAAFDNALFIAGIANYNLIYLSSIIPPHSEIIIKKTFRNNNNNFGHRLYLVLSKNFQVASGKECWSGLGWVQAKDGKGLFVEQVGEGKKTVINLINSSFNDMIKYRKEKFSSIQFIVSGAKCVKRTVCSLVAAVYKEESW